MTHADQNVSAVTDIAVIGMAGFFPDAPDLKSYWQNIVKGTVSITEIPPQRWDSRYYFDTAPTGKDRIVSKWGAFLPDIPFNPLQFGIPPKALKFIETAQLLVLESTRLALDDAGYMDREFNRSRTSVFVGAGAGEGDLGQQYSFRSQVPRFFGESADHILSGLGTAVPEWREDAFTGIITNIAAGRIADRFNLGGTNCTIDAACASALAALRTGILELATGESDMVIVGGTDTLMSPYAYTCFSKVGALSATGKSIPFDQDADGIVLGEGVATVILKRLADAERDGDPIYAVIKSVGASSDGRGKGLTVPKPEGQIAALARAYERAAIEPATISLIEAHGTSTVAGDKSEAAALHAFFSGTDMPPRSCAVGSIKSMIGHTKCAAGIASLVKTVLALHHKVIPPTAGLEKPVPDLTGEDNPLYLNTRARPWFATAGRPRRAGVSAFGFGGTNFHAVLEEYSGPTGSAGKTAFKPEWESELFVFQGKTTGAVTGRIQYLENQLARYPETPLKDLAYTMAVTPSAENNVRLAVVASSTDDLKNKIKTALMLLAEQDTRDRHIPGVYFSYRPVSETGKIAFVYPGQGSQYPGMLNDLALSFPLVRETLERFDRHLAKAFPAGLSRIINPPIYFTDKEKKADESALTRADVTQAAMGAVDTAMHELLTTLGVVPDMTAGHSYGEYPALFAAGVLAEKDLARISEARGRFILESSGSEPGTMAAVKASESEVIPLLKDLDRVWIANLNAPSQTVISGSRAGVKAAMEKLEQEKIPCKTIPVACAFHSPLVDAAKSKLENFLENIDFGVPQRPVFSNTIAAPFPENGPEIKKLMAGQLVSPVRFSAEISAMYEAGARIFIEVGANSVLTNLIKAILKDKPHQAVATNKKGRADVTELQHALAVIFVAGVELQLERLFAGRDCRRFDRQDTLSDEKSDIPEARFIIGSGTVRPADQPPPERVVPRPVGFVDEAQETETGNTENPTDFNNINTFEWEWNSQTMPSPTDQQGQSVPIETNRNPATTDDMMIARFQDLMSQFLDTQKAVMTAWLNGGSSDRAGLGECRGYETAIGPVSVNGIMPEMVQPDINHPISDRPPDFSVPPVASPDLSATKTTVPEKEERIPSLDVKTILLEIVSDCTGYPVEMLELDQEIDADLGIDSIKRMQAMMELETALEQHGVTLQESRMESLVASHTLADLLDGLQALVSEAQGPPAGKVAASAPAVTTVAPFDIKATLISIVGDLTGYPADMLELDQEIDAELGIDSIKRMEVLAHFEEKLAEHHIQMTDAGRERLGRSVTLNDIVIGLESVIGDQLKTENIDDKASAVGKAETVTPSTASLTADQKTVRNVLYQIVESHTGYPAEILEPDLRLKNDLNMDKALTETVIAKWTEVFKSDIPGAKTAADRPFPGDAACLGDLTDWMEQQIIPSVPGTLPSEERPDPLHIPPVRRYTLYAKKRGLIVSPESFPAEGTVLVTMIPGDPLARAVVAGLEPLGYNVIILEHDLPATDLTAENFNTAVYCADFTNFDRLAETVDDIRETHGPVTALLHLAPLAAGSAFPFPDLATWKKEAATMIKSLFYLTKLLATDLTSANPAGVSGIVAATAMGGTFASVVEIEKPGEPDFSPVGGGVSGFLKALAEEMPGLNIRVVDNDPKDTPQTIATQITNELLTPSADIEVGYQDGCRLVLAILEEPLITNHPPKITIGPGSRLLVTGGARGITSAIALELARRFQPTLLLVGKTPLAEENPETIGIEDERQLKAILAEQLKSQSEKVRPADLENAYHRLVAQREIRETLDRLGELGSEAHYLQRDVTDAEGFSRLIDTINETYGGIDGVIHGAGRIEDKPIKDKDITSFDRVFDTKADSLFILSQALQAGSLRFLALFSSVAGRFGNAGQSDYGAANEVYNKTALYLNRVWPGRIVSFIWGPWESRGMVSAELKEKFSAAGISLIPRDEGVNHFINELLYGPATATEVIYGGWDSRKRALTADSRTIALPLLSSNSNFYPSGNGNVELVHRLDTDHDYYLQDHKLDGYPVLPMAMAMEIMAEAVAFRYPDYFLSTFSNFHVLKGVVLKNGFETINIVVNPVISTNRQITLDIQIRDSRDKRRIYYRANVELLREKPAPGRHISLDISDPEPFTLSVSELYEKQLFHGPLWHGIQHVETIGKDGIIGRLKASRPKAYLPRTAASDDYDWLIDPLIIDSGLQLVSLWMRNRMNATPLPTRLKKFFRFDAPRNGDDLRCEVRVRTPDNNGIKSADVFFLTPEGSLTGMMEGLEIIGSESLNRLAVK